MKNALDRVMPRRVLFWLTAVAMGLTLLGTAAQPAVADLIVTVSSATDVPINSTNNALQVTLTNDGSSAVAIGSFSLSLAVSDTHIVFTQADTSTLSTYIFLNHSVNGPVISTSSPGQVLIAEDDYDVPAGAFNLNGNTTVGLARILYNVDASTPPGANYSLTFDQVVTSLTDGAGNPVTIDKFNNGSITIAGASIPEPSTLTLFATGSGVITLLGLVRRGIARRKVS